MIAINSELCDGCGTCVAICPDGALYLVDGKAMVDAGLCRGCEDCIAVCPTGAIVFLDQMASPPAESRDVVVPYPEAAVIRVKTQPVAMSLRSKVLPLVGATAAWAGRELLPIMADYLLDRLERRVTRQPRRTTRSESGASKREEGGGGRRRRRHRGGQSGSG